MFRRIAGPQTTMAAVLFGEVLDGTEAERVGLVHRCVDDDDLLAAGPGDGGAGGLGATRAADPHQGDDPGDGRRSTTIPAAVDRELAPAVVEHPAAVVRGAHRRPPGEDLAKKYGADPEARPAAASPSRVTGQGELRTPPDTASSGCNEEVLDEPATPHRPTCLPPPKEELRAQAHSERHRIHVELQDVANQVSAGLDPADCHEPGRSLEAGPPPGPRGRREQGRQVAAASSGTGS